MLPQRVAADTRLDPLVPAPVAFKRYST